jgi:hypothetical protein
MRGLRYVFRRPRFPIICNIDGVLVAGGNLQQFERRIGRVELPVGRTFGIVDASGEGWSLHPDLSVISPLTLDKHWTKAQVIEMFDTSWNAQGSGLRYPQRSLSNRRLEAVIRDVAELVTQAHRRSTSDRAQTAGR